MSADPSTVAATSATTATSSATDSVPTTLPETHPWLQTRDLTADIRDAKDLAAQDARPKVNRMCVTELIRTVTVYAQCSQTTLIWQLQWRDHDFCLSRADQFYTGEEEVYWFHIDDAQIAKLEGGLEPNEVVELIEVPDPGKPGSTVIDGGVQLLIREGPVHVTPHGNVRRLVFQFGWAVTITFNAELLKVLKKWRAERAH